MKDENDQPWISDQLNDINKQIPQCKKAYHSEKSPSYSFTANQWEEILENGTNASLSDKFRTNKVERLSERFENLLADISVLGEQNVFEEGLHEWEDWDWTPMWKQIVRTEHHTRRSLSRPLASIKLPSEQMHQRDFGIELGRAVQFLSRSVESFDREAILFGFLLGLFIEDASPDPKELHNVEQTISELKPKFERWKYMHSYSGSQIKSSLANLQNVQVTLEHKLHIEGITPTDPIKNYVDSQVESDPSFIFDQEVRRQENKQVESIIEDLIDQEILKLEKLARVSKEDFTEIYEKDFQGESFMSIFNQLAKANQRMDLDEVEFQVAKTQRKRVLKILSGQTEYERWQNRPVLHEPVENEWKVTKYGRFLHYGWLSNEEFESWLHQYIIGSEELSDEEYHIIEAILKDFDELILDDL